MRLPLKLHPDSPCPAVTQIAVDIARPRPGQLSLRYGVTGTIDRLRLSPAASPARVDELWQHTCFEAFVRGPTGETYCEFNFAPSTQWAVYRLDGYRSGMRAAGAAPSIEVRTEPTTFTLLALLDLGPLTDLPRDGRWRLGLSAIIEETDGGKSYWALAHPPGKPDFHHPDCFAHEFSPT
jgi:hypothetical protein